MRTGSSERPTWPFIHVGQSTVIYLANGAVDFLGTGQTTTLGPSLLRITIT